MEKYLFLVFFFLLILIVIYINPFTSSLMNIGDAAYNKESTIVAQILQLDLVNQNTKKYPETLITIKPLNWVIHTNNGINFNYLVSNFNTNNLCNSETQTSCMKFTCGKKDFEKSCLNLNYNQLIRLFSSSYQNEIIVNMYDEFPTNQKFNVINILNFLINKKYI